MSARREREDLPPPPEIDLGVAFGMPRPPPGSNHKEALLEWFAQRRNELAAEQQRRAEEEEANAVLSETETNVGGDAAFGSARAAAPRSRNGSAGGDSARASRKRLAEDDNLRVDANTKRRASESSVLAAASRGVASIPSQAPAPNEKPAAESPLALEAKKRDRWKQKRRAAMPAGVKRRAKPTDTALAARKSGEAGVQLNGEHIVNIGGQPGVREETSAYVELTGNKNPSSNDNGELSSGIKRCVPLIPTPAKCSSTSQQSALSFHDELVNYPQYVGQKGHVNDEGTKTRNCVMCGEECPYVSTQKDAPEETPRLILRRDGAICTECRGHVWQVVGTKLEVRRCQECRKWYPWATFEGTKGMVKQCPKCRSRDRKRGGASEPSPTQAGNPDLDHSTEQRRAEEEANGALSHPANSAGNAQEAAPASRNSSADSDSARESRKRSAEDGNQREDVTAKRRASESFALAAATSDVASIQSQPPAPNVRPLVLEANRNHVGATESTSLAAMRSPLVSNRIANGLNRCVPLIPAPVACSSTAGTVPPFNDMVNFPQYIGRTGNSNMQTRNCVMCGHECPYVTSKKHAPNEERLILVNCSGVCTVCSEHVWQVVDSGLQVRRCQICRKWGPWASFQGNKGMVKQCPSCRTRGQKRDRRNRDQQVSG